VRAWAVHEGDVSPSGLSIVSVQRDPSAGKVHIGYSNGQGITLTGERTLVVITPRPLAAIFLHGVYRARQYLARS
jgi:hypothetical protein